MLSSMTLSLVYCLVCQMHWGCMLCGQAYGAGKIESVGLGVDLQRSWIVLLLTCIILLPIYIFAAPFLKLLDQEKDIASLLENSCIYDSSVIFLCNQFAHPEIPHITEQSYGDCMDCTCGSNYIKWAGLHLCICIMMGLVEGRLEWIPLNAVIAIGSYSVCGNIQCWVTMFFIGINIAVSVRVSIELGMGHPRRDKYSFFVTMFQSLLIGIFVLIVIFLARDYLGIIFTNSEDMQRGIACPAYLLAMSLVIGAASQVMTGVAIGSGWQVMVAYVNLSCYYIFELPLGIILFSRANLGITGLWGGMLCGNAAQTLIVSFIIWRFNWNKEVEQTTKRIQEWGSYNDKPKKKIICPYPTSESACFHGCWDFGEVCYVELLFKPCYSCWYSIKPIGTRRYVEQTNERMRKWGGQDIKVEDIADPI
ncbi:Protein DETOXIFICATION [Quillaja saponaria]|uniref:Protein DETOXIFICATION n=1 Tax=Quillaja saponaria TaxID=32244 RepID=A0AAD7PWX4_QUISA|nr:Protein DETOXIFICATION [Quillaja saponaria]